MIWRPTVGGQVILGENHFELELIEGRWAVNWRQRYVEAFADLADAMDAAERFDRDWPTEPNVELAAANYHE